jgi:hypothetical protein
MTTAAPIKNPIKAKIVILNICSDKNGRYFTVCTITLYIISGMLNHPRLLVYLSKRDVNIPKDIL